MKWSRFTRHSKEAEEQEAHTQPQDEGTGGGEEEDPEMDGGHKIKVF